MVQFNPRVRVRRIRHINELPTEMRSKLWISKSEIKKIKEETIGLKEILTMRSSVYEAGGLLLHLHGLETRRDRQAKHMRTRVAIRAVLKEQRRQDDLHNNRSVRFAVETGIYERMLLAVADKYEKHSQPAAEEAHQRGLKQAQFVEKEPWESQHMNVDEKIGCLNDVIERIHQSSGHNTSPCALIESDGDEENDGSLQQRNRGSEKPIQSFIVKEPATRPSKIQESLERSARAA